MGGFRVTLTVLPDLDTANGTLSVTPAGNATVPVNNDRVLTIEGTQADVNATLATLRYTVPTVDFNHLNNQDTANPSGDVFVSVHVSDQKNTSDPDLATEWTKTDTMTITVNAVNDAPSLTVGSLTLSLNEGDNISGVLNTVAIAGVVVSDVDETEPTGTGLLLVTLTVLADTDSSNGILSVTPSGTADVPVNNSRVLTIRGTQDDVNATLATLLYTLPNTDFNELNNQDGLNPTGGVFVSLHVSDEGNTGDPPPVVGTDAKTVTITVLPVNDAPTFVPDGNVQLDEDDTASMVRPGWATGITVGPATATDEASQTLTFNVTVLQTTGHAAVHHSASH